MESLPEVKCDCQKFLGPPFLPFPLEVSMSVDEGCTWLHHLLRPPPPRAVILAPRRGGALSGT